MIVNNNKYKMVSTILEKAKSKSQQRFFSMVRSVQKGEMEAPSEKIKKLADEMDEADVKEYANTKTTGLPEKKKKED